MTSLGSVVVAPSVVASSSELSAYPRSATARACSRSAIWCPRFSTSKSTSWRVSGNGTLSSITPASRAASGSSARRCAAGSPGRACGSRVNSGTASRIASNGRLPRCGAGHTMPWRRDEASAGVPRSCAPRIRPRDQPRRKPWRRSRPGLPAAGRPGRATASRVLAPIRPSPVARQPVPGLQRAARALVASGLAASLSAFREPQPWTAAVASETNCASAGRSS